MQKPFVKLLCVVLFGMSISSIFIHTTSRAEGTDTPKATEEVAGQKVSIKTADGLELVGLFYPVTVSKAPAVLLIHDGVSSKTQWLPFVPVFTEAGYNVLAIDLRGMGESAKSSTGGNAAELQDKDMPTIVAWLRNQPTVDPDAVALIGARLGANFAIRACANDEKCHTVIALTPSTDFFGIKTEEAIKQMTKDKAVFLVATQFGENGAQTIKRLTTAAPDTLNLMTRMYAIGFEYGTGMFKSDPNLMPMVLMWLNTYNHS